MPDRRTIGDLSETDIPYRTPRHAPSDTDMPHRTPECPIGDRHAPYETDMHVETHPNSNTSILIFEF